MIICGIRETGNFVHIKVKGHAMHAQDGEPDIVCAGMSMLCYALAEAERQAGELGVMKEEDGLMELRFSNTEGALKRMQVFTAGVQLLSARYPECFVGEKSEGAM